MAVQYVSEEFMNQLGKYVPKEALSGVGFITSNNTNGTCGTWAISVGDAGNGWNWVAGTFDNDSQKVIAKQFIPTKIIYCCPATICFFPDGTKTIVKCAEDEEYIKEEGVMACIMKKLFSSRTQFKKLVNSGYENAEAIFEREAHNESLFNSRDI
jgi:hypothetical protein